MRHGKARKIGLAFATALAILFFVAMLAGCPHPIPPPVPGPVPSPADAGSVDTAPSDALATPDPFKGRDFDCHLPIVAAQYTVASPKVGACLSSSPLACLEGLLPSYDVATVACLVRDLGAEVAAKVLGGTASAGEAVLSSFANSFINGENLGFK